MKKATFGRKLRYVFDVEPSTLQCKAVHVSTLRCLTHPVKTHFTPYHQLVIWSQLTFMRKNTYFLFPNFINATPMAIQSNSRTRVMSPQNTPNAPGIESPPTAKAKPPSRTPSCIGEKRKDY